ncbi:hypothetical protein [Filimonas effusa]|uniref:Secreted protein n=1 Tax=Filimonas effusa TaxID=2508721 RepID=A0A4Q1D3K5_9BACT|nr:hypothetical protein [Filimonas effusa]RXK81753.1 hypothetical protein ESB13_18345 [Filimonas effusa]
MKRVTLALSAVAITATVGTAMAHNKTVNTPWCLAHTNGIPVQYNGDPTALNCTLTVFLRDEPQPSPTFYAVPKTTPAGQPCQEVESCPAINLLGEGA